MEHRRTSVVKLYLWIAEAMAFYLPLGLLYYLLPTQTLPFWSFLLGVLGSYVFLFVGSKLTARYIPVLIYIPLAVFAFSFIGPFNLIMAILLSAYLAWRFIVHERDPDLRNEQTLLMISLGILIVNVLYFNQEKVYLMAALQLVVLVFGYMVSQVVSVDSRANQKRVNTRTATVMGSFIGVMVGIFFIYDVIRAGFTGGGLIIAKAFSGVVTGIFFILEWLGVGEFWQERVDKQNPPDMELGESVDRSPDPTVTSDLSDLLYGGVILLLIVIGVVIAIRLRNKRMEQFVDVAAEEDSVTYTSLLKERESSWGSSFKRIFQSAPTDEARKLFFKFEAFAAKRGKGRAPSETIEEWFERLGVKEGDVDLYQKVRYGDQPLSQQELDLFKRTIESLREAIQNS
ncbi:MULTISPECIES: DUF4129 domain-containing protein [Pontibacillus]|uniref:DUF4129 domain-containing protein n=1 Tax=Pontibacillus chungwhensis TaxID=265426 RepID=A0ABY8UYD7_9BACI|nr:MULTISPECIES: DUF4129 domain-containing protein [Pontibacillus]MCD5325845.1 DUF4129 domain-containing protein [Pontibacillus sp. HN14]WIF98375.1 DUF4129 domain-containing protein [Pontibacillus chungwhensis]